MRYVGCFKGSVVSAGPSTGPGVAGAEWMPRAWPPGRSDPGKQSLAVEGLPLLGSWSCSVSFRKHDGNGMCDELCFRQDAALLRAVLSANMITSLLAMDAWCFLARYGALAFLVSGWFMVGTGSAVLFTWKLIEFRQEPFCSPSRLHVPARERDLGSLFPLVCQERPVA